MSLPEFHRQLYYPVCLGTTIYVRRTDSLLRNSLGSKSMLAVGLVMGQLQWEQLQALQTGSLLEGSAEGLRIQSGGMLTRELGRIDASSALQAQI